MLESGKRFAPFLLLLAWCVMAVSGLGCEDIPAVTVDPDLSPDDGDDAGGDEDAEESPASDGDEAEAEEEPNDIDPLPLPEALGEGEARGGPIGGYDESLVEATCKEAVRKIMQPDPATGDDQKIAARREALDRLYEGLGASRGRVQAVFRDLAAEKLGALLRGPSPQGWGIH